MESSGQLTFLQWIEIACFVLGYFAIIFEHAIGINKATSALIMAVFLWAFKFCDGNPVSGNIQHLNEHLANISQVVLFLLGALTIVEQIHAHGGLAIVGRFLQTSSGVRALLLVSTISFFMSSLLDNLTTTIVMIMLLKKCIEDQKLRLVFGSVVVIAANAGGAWTPIGDVTTTMLWIGEKLSTTYIMSSLFLPSITCLIVSGLVLSRYIPKQIVPYQEAGKLEPKARTVLILGSLSLISVPIFKSVTGLPPFMGMLFAMAFMWLVTDVLHREYEEREHLRVMRIFPKVDMSGILFFLGILLAVSSLEEAGILHIWARFLDQAIPSKELVAFVIGLISAVIDNVPLVAASMGMYDAATYPLDNPFWSLIAYCAGTGGSILVIGSAAGVAFMGLEKVDFFWYMRRIGPAAFIGYTAGILVWILQNTI